MVVGEDTGPIHFYRHRGDRSLVEVEIPRSSFLVWRVDGHAPRMLRGNCSCGIKT